LLLLLLLLLLFALMGWDYVSECGHQRAPDDIWVWRATVEWSWQGNPNNSDKACPSVTLYTTNLTWTDRGVNGGLLGDRPALTAWDTHQCHRYPPMSDIRYVEVYVATHLISVAMSVGWYC
jgi:hypothetical protein